MVLSKRWERLEVQNGVLYGVTKDHISQQKRQDVPPVSLIMAYMMLLDIKGPCI